MKDLPTIIVLGSSSTGKSALIDRLFATTFSENDSRKSRAEYEPTVESLYVRCCGVTLTQRDVETILDRDFFKSVDLSNVRTRRAVRYELTINPRFSRDLHRWRCDGASDQDAAEKTIDCFVTYQLYDTSGDVCRCDDLPNTFRKNRGTRKRLSLGETTELAENRKTFRRSLSRRAMVRSAIAAIERRRETLRLKYIRRADVLVLVYNPTDEDSVRATLTCLDSRTKISTEKIVLIFENLRRGVSKNATRDDKPAPYYQSLRFFCPYENVDFGKTMTSFEMSTPRLVGKRPSFDTVRYFYSCDLTDPSSGTIVRDAIRVAMKRVILGRYVLTG